MIQNVIQVYLTNKQYKLLFPVIIQFSFFSSFIVFLSLSTSMVTLFLFQSFFFNPLSSQFQNYCYFVPVLPYFVHFDQSSSINLKSEICQFMIKKPETGEISIKITESTIEQQKFKNLPYLQQQLKIQESIVLQIKKPSAAFKSMEFVKNEIVTDKILTLTDKSSVQVSANSDWKSFGKISKGIKIKKIKLNQEEYQPFQKRKRCESYIKENQNRNIIPNEVNQIFSYIQKSSKSKLVLNRIFTKYPPSNPQYTIKKFYLYQSLLKEKVSNYINQTSLSLVTELYEPMCQIYSKVQQLYYKKICRVLIHHFLQQDSIFNILTSRRMHNGKKRSHLEMRRELKSKVVEILRR